MVCADRGLFGSPPSVLWGCLEPAEEEWVLRSLESEGMKVLKEGTLLHSNKIGHIDFDAEEEPKQLSMREHITLGGLPQRTHPSQPERLSTLHGYKVDHVLKIAQAAWRQWVPPGGRRRRR